MIGLAAVALSYVVVVRDVSGSSSHPADQVPQDGYYVTPIMPRFGVQVALVSELRRRHRLQHGAAAAGGVGAGASSAGRIACCGHHIADLTPFVGATRRGLVTH